MSNTFPNIKSVVVRVITDKPVRKTPYQVKGVFMRQYPDEPIIPMLDGSYRDRFLYPRVQVKILNEQIYIIGIHEGVDSVLSIAEKFEMFVFGYMLGALEHHVLKQMCEARVTGKFVLRPNPIPNVHRHNRHGAVLRKDNL